MQRSLFAGMTEFWSLTGPMRYDGVLEYDEILR